MENTWFIFPDAVAVVTSWLIRSVETGQTRELRPKLQYFQMPRGAPDGRSVAVQASDLKGRQGIYRVDAQTGDAEAIVLNPLGVASPLAWAPDGKRLFYQRRSAWDETVIVARPRGGLRIAAPCCI